MWFFVNDSERSTHLLERTAAAKQAQLDFLRNSISGLGEGGGGYEGEFP